MGTETLIVEAAEAAQNWPDDLRLIQRAEGLTQAGLARSLGVSEVDIHHWLNRKRTPANPFIILRVNKWAERLRNGS